MKYNQTITVLYDGEDIIDILKDKDYRIEMLLERIEHLEMSLQTLEANALKLAEMKDKEILEARALAEEIRDKLQSANGTWYPLPWEVGK